VWSLDNDNGELLAAIAPMVAGNPAKVPIGTTTTTATTAAPTTTAKTTTTTVGSGTTTTVKTTTASASATATATGAPTGCAGVAAWNTATAYVGGSYVTYNGSLYKAQWWTQGEVPATTASWSTWQIVQAC
jgi:chitodextrinase